MNDLNEIKNLFATIRKFLGASVALHQAFDSLETGFMQIVEVNDKLSLVVRDLMDERDDLIQKLREQSK